MVQLCVVKHTLAQGVEKCSLYIFIVIQREMRYVVISKYPFSVLPTFLVSQIIFRKGLVIAVENLSNIRLILSHELYAFVTIKYLLKVGNTAFLLFQMTADSRGNGLEFKRPFYASIRGSNSLTHKASSYHNLWVLLYVPKTIKSPNLVPIQFTI